MIPISNYEGEYKNYLKRVFNNSELVSLQKEYTKKYIIYGISAALIAKVLLWITITYLFKPLIYLEQKVRKLESGVLVEPIELKSSDEIGYLAGAMENMRKSLYKRESELKEQSYIDPLTGVYNRLYLNHRINQIIEKASYPISLIMADIDGLKKINDKYGHAAGDEHIINCIKVIKRAMRDNDELFRIGGDEFILLFTNTDQEAGEFILERIKREMELHNNTLNSDEMILSVSFGLGVCKGEFDSLDDALASADKRMYENKAEKR